jgi:phosphoglycerate dehydrogenase-like enzyme
MSSLPQKTRVAVLDDYARRVATFADWGSLGEGVEVTYFYDPIPEDRRAATLGEFEVLVLMRERTPLPRSVLERLPNLRLVVTTGMVNASVDSEFLRAKGVVMAGTGLGAGELPGVMSTTELAWALIFVTTKRLLAEDRSVRAGAWQVAFPTLLAGTTLGLAGLGRLGSEMVAPARAFGMDVVAWSQNLTRERTDEAGVELVTKEDLLRRSDVLSIHLVLSRRTRGAFGAAELALMKPTAVLINTSRGPIVDEAALIDALRAGRLAAAGLDVFDREPMAAGHPLLSLERTVLTPHLGYVSESGFRSGYRQVVENIAAFLDGNPIRVID